MRSGHSQTRFSCFSYVLLPLLTVSGLGGCRSEDVVSVVAPRSTVIFNVPGGGLSELAASPDGALFAAHSGGVDRLIPSESPEWKHLTRPNFLPIAFYAPSRNTVFALGQASGEVHRWDSGGVFTPMHTPLRDSVAHSGHVTTPIPLSSIWGRGIEDVYAVGNYAATMHFDGRRWTLQPNPLVKEAFASYRAALWSVGGDRDHVFAAGTFDLISKTEQGWTIAALPTEGVPHGWMLALQYGNGTIVIGRKRDVPGIVAFQRLNARWVSLSNKFGAVRGDIADGASQADGSVVFWTHHRELIHLRPDHTATIYTNFPLYLIIGAAVVNGRLYVGGTRRNNAVVLEIH